jgi:hypothetical protein
LLARPNTFRHFTGVLEDILAGKDRQLRRFLVWRNTYYGRSQKIDRHFLGAGYGANPTLALHPEAFEHFDRLVQFSAEFRKRMRGA